VKNTDQDKAGQKYWNNTWDVIPLPELWPIDSKNIKDNVERSLFKFMSDAFMTHGAINRNGLLVEVGCARSAVLPLFTKRLGLRISGIDYSPNGCEQSRLMLEREGVQGEIHCCDIFSLPEDLSERFDIVVSFGLIEHFSNTSEIVTALSRLVKPGGLIFTNVPNMNGIIGFAQKIMDKKIYDIHVPLDAEAVRKAHTNAGLEVISCDYFLSTNFGVLNLNSIRTHSFEWWVKKLMLALLTRISMGIWMWERAFGSLPTSRFFSPYVNCLAIKPKKAE